MLIDWFTVIAQIINFIVLLFLLKRFLYGPILNAVDSREKRIADQIKDAEEKERKAEKDRQEYLQKKEEFNLQYNDLMSQAIKEASERKSELMEEARNESVELKERMLKSLESEKKSLANDIMQKTQGEVFSITRKVLRDLSNLTLEEQMIEVFIHRLTEMELKEKQKLVENKMGEEHLFIINTSFDLSETFRNRLENIIRQMASDLIADRRKSGIKIEFGRNEAIIGGIELIAGGYKISWSISEYIGSMEKHVSEVLKNKIDDNKES